MYAIGLEDCTATCTVIQKQEKRNRNQKEVMHPERTKEKC